MILNTILSKDGCQLAVYMSPHSDGMPVLEAQEAGGSRPTFEFTDQEDLDWLIDSLIEMRKAAWPEPQDPEDGLTAEEDEEIAAQAANLTLWSRVREEFSAKFPLQAGYIKEMHFWAFREGADDRGHLILRTNPDHHMAIQMLERPVTRAALEEIISRTFGGRHQVRFMMEINELVPYEQWLATRQALQGAQ